jgi:hypothetical protein
LSGGCFTFFGRVTIPLVRKGGNETGFDRLTVYTEMILQVTRDFSGIPDYRTMNMSEIRYFYEGLRTELKEVTKPQPKGK